MAVIPIQHLPLGFRFHPTDAELINHYLKRKINGRIRSDPVAVIPEIDVCKSEPWDLPDKALIQSGDGEWFFFAPRDRKYVNSARHNRATEAGYWKATGKDRVIRGRGVEIGRKKTLVFHRGRAPKGERTGWIMHEYRTVEPEFETGEEGQFVLCRLFKKLEENNSSSNADELESGGFSPALTKSSVSDTQHGPDTSEEFGTRPPESNLQQNLQALPLSAHSQQLGSQGCVWNEADCSTTYPSKPEESHCTDSTVSDLADYSGPEDVLPQFIEHCSNGGPSSSTPLLPIDEDIMFHDYSSTEWLQDADANATPDANADLEYLESLLNDDEDDFSDLINIQNDFVDAVEPVYQVCPTMFPPLDSKPFKDIGTSSMVDLEPLFTQEHSQAYGSGMIHPLLFAPNVELNTTHSYPEREAQINLIREASPREMTGQSVPWVDVSCDPLISNSSRPERFYDTGAECFQSSSRNMEDSNTQVGHSLTGIKIKYRQPRVISRNTDADQGSALRRLRLQSCDSKTNSVVKAEPKEGEYSEHQIAEEREISRSILDELEGHSLTGIKIKYRQPRMISRNTDADQGSAVRRLRLQCCDSKTDFVVKAAPKEGEYSEHQIAEERDISCSILDELEGLSDNDDSTYLDTKPIPESAQESKPSVRLRKKLTNDRGKELEGKTSHRQTHGSVSVNKVIMPMFVFLLLLCVGTWYHIYF